MAETIDDGLRKLLARRDEAVMDLIVRFGLVGLKEMLRVFLGQRDKIDFAAWSARSADDVLALIREVQRRVLDATGIELEPELRLVGFDGAADR